MGMERQDDSENGIILDSIKSFVVLDTEVYGRLSPARVARATALFAISRAYRS